MKPSTRLKMPHARPAAEASGQLSQAETASTTPIRTASPSAAGRLGTTGRSALPGFQESGRGEKTLPTGE